MINDRDSGVAGVTPGCAPGILDKPVVKLEVFVVAVSNDGDSRVDWRLRGGAGRARDDASFVELELLCASRDGCRNGTKLHCDFHLVGIVRQHVDEVCGLHNALLRVELALLRYAHIGVVLVRHQWIRHGVLEGIREQTSMAAPRIVVAIKDLLRGKAHRLARLEEDVRFDDIDGHVGPG